MPLIKLNATQGLTGTLPAVSGANLTNIDAGKVLQVVQATKTDTFSTGTNTFVDVTGLTLNITPSSSSNKIFIICDVKLGVDAGVSAVKSRIEQTISGSDTYPYIGDAEQEQVLEVLM
jgi:hypothetical protein